MRARSFVVMLLAAFVAMTLASSGAAQTATTFGPKQYTRTEPRVVLDHLGRVRLVRGA